jgi:hypothetical protein
MILAGDISDALTGKWLQVSDIIAGQEAINGVPVIWLLFACLALTPESIPPALRGG